MISPRGRLCLLQEGDGVFWNYFSRLSYMTGNRPAILCMSSTEVFSSAGMVTVGRWCWVTFSAGGPTNLDNGRARAYCAFSRCGWGRSDISSLVYHFFSFTLPLRWMDDF